MIIRAELRRKQSEYEGEACVIDKVIELPAQRFKQFSRALLADYDSCSSARICASDTSFRLAIIVMALFARPNSSSVYMSLSSF